ncbi:MAG: hypothetical protein J0L84_00640 [Verrucomicrobia bacterium]|nr:hypothetical protein [Verrucomicrobiota bacterium]
MPRPSNRRGLVIAGGFAALLLIAAVIMNSRPRRAANATFLGMTTNSAGIRLAEFLISNRSSNSLLGTMYFVAADSSTKAKGFDMIRAHWLRDGEIRLNGGIQIGLREAPRDGEWILKGSLVTATPPVLQRSPQNGFAG